MSVEYEDYELLDLFCMEPIISYENTKEEEHRYIWVDKYGVEIQFVLYPYEEKCSIELRYGNLENRIFYTELNDVKKLIKSGNKMHIVHNNEEIVSINSISHISVSYIFGGIITYIGEDYKYGI